MRIHLRHTQTGQLFQSPNTWTDDPGMAYDFKFPDLAQKFAETWEITDVELCFGTDVSWRVAEELIIVPFAAEAHFAKAA